MNYKIELIPDKNGKTPDIFYSPLYQMLKEELLVLQKTLIKYLNKEFIWMSNLPAVIPMLFAWKFNNELWFYIDY